MISKRFVGALLAAFIAVPAYAQTTPPTVPDQNVKMRIGPLWLNPALALTNAGVDTNVFNAPDDGGPQKDFTATVTPQTSVWLRAGRTWVEGIIKEDIVYYKKFASQRSVNNNYSVGWLIPLTRVTFSLGGNWVSTRDRPGFEIDARAQQNQSAYGGTMEIQGLSKTFFGFRGEQRTITFDQSAVFLDTNLNDALTRTDTVGTVTLRYQLTPLTNVTADVSREQDRFKLDALRDSNSTTASFGLKFDPAALLKGSVQVGFRDFMPLSPAVPAYRGTTMGMNLSYVAFESTQLGVEATRDVQYSFDITQPYYLLTGVTGTVTQQIFGPVDLQARAGANRLAYRDQVGAAVAVSNRIDHVQSYGVGLGYHLGGGLRLAFNVNKQKRLSAIDSRQYNNLTYGTSLTYGF